MEIIIDEEFHNLIPPLHEEEFKQLEESVIKEGCRDVLVLWGKILLDGHNRYEICSKNNIPFKTTQKEFKDRNEAKIWIIQNQFGRRNINAYQKSVLAIKLKSIFEEIAKKNISLSGGDKKSEEYKSGLTKSSKPIESIHTRKELSKIAHVSEDTIQKVEKIEKEATKEEKKELVEGKASINEIYMKVRRKNRVISQTPPLPEGKFNILYADPPYKYDFSLTVSREIAQNYPDMDTDDICALKDKLPVDDNVVLLLWCPAPKLKDGLRIMQEWGFTYKTHAVWDKEIIGMGYWFRSQHELLLLGVKGNFSPPDPSSLFSSIIREKRTEHSKKPEKVYDMIEKMFPQGKYLELFSRTKRNNWTGWGLDYPSGNNGQK
jgi:N6-adenosine-specific RNA methylase IME4